MVTKKKLRKFVNELTLWNFETAYRLALEFSDFPKNALYLISSLMSNYGDCGSPRTGYAYVRVPKAVNEIMKIAKPWIESKNGEGKPKAIAV